jgi:4-hydroxythreonine-4-phosphate dehydrogenase
MSGDGGARRPTASVDPGSVPFGITLGDASGIGPEVLLKAYRDGALRHPVVVYGDLAVLEHYDRLLGYGVPLRRVTAPREAPRADGLAVLDHGLVGSGQVAVGKLDARSGAAARRYVVSAAQAALAAEIRAVVTLPMNKEATQLVDPGFVGHTELLGEVCGVADVTIMLVTDDVIATHVSTHVSLAEAIARVKRDRIVKILELTCAAVARLRENPRIAVAGLNPHAGENGLFGDEELREIRPAIEWARARGLPVEGPFPPDTVFYLEVRRKRFDAVVCMYHDQGHVPLKLLDFEGGVNVALGLPIVRTSVDHGTAFDIAGRGVASCESLVKALDLAARLAGSA